MKVATYNASGGVSVDIDTLKNNFFDHRQDCINYKLLNEIIQLINKEEIDIIGMQEVPTNIKEFMQEIAAKTNLKHYVSLEMHDNHLINGVKMGLALFSRFPIKNSKHVFMKNPNLTVTTSSGNVYLLHNKAYTITEIDANGRKCTVFNTQGFPFHRFKRKAIEFKNIFISSEKDIKAHDADVVVGDFNIIELNANNVSSFYPYLAKNYNKLFNCVTTKDDKWSDNIFIKNYSLVSTKIISAMSDHFLLIAEIK